MNLLAQAERLRKMLFGEIPDRVPNYEFFFDNPAIFKHFVGREYTRTWPDQLDLALKIGWGAVVTDQFGLMLGYHSDVASDGTAHYSGGDGLTWQSLEEMAVPEIDERIEEVTRRVTQVRESGLMSVVFLLHCFHSAATGIGLERFAMLCYDDLPLVKAYMERIERFNRRVLAALIDAGSLPDIVFFDADCAYKNAMMVRPQMYRDLVFDPTDKTLQILRERGVPYCFHSDGKVDDIYPVWIDLGVWGAHGVEAQANDLAEVKSRFGDRIALFGNMDPVRLAWGTPEEVEQLAEQMVVAGKAGGRYAAAVNTIVSDYTPLENYLAFQRAIDRVGWYDV